MSSHQHEAWQIRHDPDGRAYCAACGDKLPTYVVIIGPPSGETHPQVNYLGTDRDAAVEAFRDCREVIPESRWDRIRFGTVTWEDPT